MKIAVIEFIAGIVLQNERQCFEGQELKCSDDINASNGTCILKFIKSGRLNDISGLLANIGSLALLNEKSIEIKAIHG